MFIIYINKSKNMPLRTKALKTALNELKLRVSPYLEFWEEWIGTDACFLEKQEITIIAIQLKKGFSASLFERSRYYNQPEQLQKLSHKLRSRYSHFQEWVICKFFGVLLYMGKAYGTDLFFDTPIHALQLPQPARAVLLRFNIRYLQQLAFAFKPNDFKRAAVYANVLCFLRLY